MVLLESAIHSATFWTAVAAIGSVVALFLIYRQVASARDVSAYQFLRSEDERFESQEMAQERSTLARTLILYPDNFDRIDQDAEGICDYFEDLGLMLKKRITPKYFTWTMYYDSIVNYWCLLKSYVQWYRTTTGDSTYYCEFEYLYGKMLQLQKIETKTKETRPPARQDLDDFLWGELALEVRHFRLDDLPAVMEIERCSFGIDAYSEEQFRVLYERYSECFLVAEILGQLAAYIVAYIEGSVGEIDSMAVHPSHRGLKIASHLLREALQYFKEMRITRCSLEVRTTNNKAIALYERQGFQKQDTLHNYYEDGADAYRMVKTNL